jgi:hypothetical protein
MQQMLGQLQQTLQMFQQQNSALTQALNNAHDRIDAREQELASKERIAVLDAQVELVKTAAELKSDQALAMLKHTSAIAQKRLELDGINEPIDNESTTEKPRSVLPPPKPILPFQPKPQGMPNANPGQPFAFPAGNPGPGPGAPGPGPGAGPGFPPGAPGPFGPAGGGSFGPGGPGGLPGR